MQVEFVSDRCRDLFARGDLAVIGISPFNSYFSEDRIARLATWARGHFRQVMFYLPDGPTVYTLRALGYDADKARKKARRQCNYLRNKIFRAADTGSMHRELMDSSWLAQSEVYARKLERIERLFDEDAEFRAGCLQSSRWVLNNHLAGRQITPQMLSTAVRYFLAELPLFLHAADIAGSASACFCYQSCPSFLARLLARGYPQLVDGRHGLVIVQQKKEEHVEPCLATKR